MGFNENIPIKFVYFLFSLAMGSVYSNYYSLNFISYIFNKKIKNDILPTKCHLTIPIKIVVCTKITFFFI